MSELERGRECYQRRSWAEAHRLLSLADRAAALAGADLELLAMAAYLIGRDEEYLATLERAHDAHRGAGAGLRAARCAFWLGLRLLFRGEAGRAGGWLARARRLVDRERCECVEQGYLLLPDSQQQIMAGEIEAGHLAAERAAAIGERFGDPDLVACARHVQGRGRLQQGRVAAGLALLDEVMVAVTGGKLSPLVTGLIYCSVIEGCQQVYALERAREWTSALASWCEEQPELVAFTGTCLVHRAEIMQMNGAWGDAIVEGRRAQERCRLAGNRRAAAAAFYQNGEVHRLRGEFAEAEEAYRDASRQGFDPQPGLALLRLAQGRRDAALAAIRRAAGAATDRVQRTRLLPALVEIALAAGGKEEARGACRELGEIAAAFDTTVMSAISAHARGALELAGGEARAALVSLRFAWSAWQQVEAPYEGARTRVLMGLACRALGDGDGSELELTAARSVFERLGAAPELSRLDALAGGAAPAPAHGLTRRELQVLRMVAAGKSNKAVAAELLLSEKTVERHVSNIFTKLDVPSRSAATAYAHQNKLI
jgi:DNA-binding CsgD family transcriptional regulator/tetratricopeptide (TPR) repeat protein